MVTLLTDATAMPTYKKGGKSSGKSRPVPTFQGNA
jgi:hypothetical protein